MTRINYRAVLSLTEPNHQIFLRFRQDDTQTQTLSVEVTANGKLFPFPGYTVEFVNITRSDSGQPIIEKVDSISPENARIEFTLGARSLQWLGKNVAYFSFKDSTGNEVFSTHNFEYEVVHGVHKEPILDSGYLWKCEEVIEKTEGLVDRIDGILGKDPATGLAKEIVTVDNKVTAVDNKLTKHIDDKNNPHKTTKEQVGLGNVPNFPVATEEQAKGSSNDSLMTPHSTTVAISSKLEQFRRYSGTAYAAHRGNNSDFPENSSMAAKMSKRHKYVEFDVQTTSDGHWVVMHDATVDRTTNGTGRVDEMTYEQIRKLRIDTGANVGKLPDWEKVVPTLEEMIKYAKFAHCTPIIEIKADEGMEYTDEELQSFVHILNSRGVLVGGCIVISFNEDILVRLRALAIELELMWVTYGLYDGYLEKCLANKMGIDAQWNDSTITEAYIQSFHDVGLKVGVWTAPQSAFSDLESKGVDIITTNSRSGDYIYQELALENGFTNTGWAGQPNAHVEQIGPMTFRVHLVLNNGTNTAGKVIAKLPGAIQPWNDTLADCTYKDGSGTIHWGTIDVKGGLSSDEAHLAVGKGWDARTDWVAATFAYEII